MGKWNSGIFMLTNLFLWWCVAYKLQNRHFCRQKQRQTLVCYHRWQCTVQTAEPPLLSSKATTTPCLLPPLAMYSANCRAATFVVGSNDTVGDVQFFCCPALIAMNVVDAANTNKTNSCMNEHT